MRDVVNALKAGIEAPKELVYGKAFNVGIENGNYTIKDLEAVKKIIPNCDIAFTGEHLVDPRSYRVSFKRILNDLRDYYKPRWNEEA